MQLDKAQRKKDYGMLSLKWDVDAIPLSPRLKDHGKGEGRGVQELEVMDDYKETVFPHNRAVICVN